jgi:ribosomal protein L15
MGRSGEKKKGGRGKAGKGATAKPKVSQKEQPSKSAPKVKKDADGKKNKEEKKAQDPPQVTKLDNMSLRERLAQKSAVNLDKMPIKMGTDANSGQARLDFSKIGAKRTYLEKNETHDIDMDDEEIPKQQ